MKRTVIAFCAVALLMAGCSSKVTVASTTPAGTDTPVATINGAPITDAELTAAAKSQLQKLDAQIYQIKSNALDNLIDDRLIAEAAKQKGIGVQEYLDAEVESKVTEPTEEEMKAFYEMRKGKDTEPYDKLKDQIGNYLKQTGMARQQQQLVASLREAANVKILMEPPRVEIDNDGAPFMGNKNAKITIVEFSDYQCPFCKRARPTISQILDTYKNDVKYVFRDFPLSFHAQAQKAHEAARCAGDQNKYFEYNGRLFDNQSSLAVTELKKYAKELQLNSKKFDDCLDAGKYAKKVQEDQQIGIRAGVSGTPAFFINGIALSGAQPFEAFKEIIERELKR